MSLLRKVVNKPLYQLFGVLICAVTCSCQNSFAWSYNAHEGISRWVFSEFDDRQRQYFSQLGQILSKSQGLDSEANFIFLAQWPDQVRDEPLVLLFQKFGATIPKTLKGFAEASTSRWHYHNAPVFTDEAEKAGCDFRNSGMLLEVMSLLDQALQSPLSKQQEAIVLALQIHLFQDIHQPTHAFSRVKGDCKHDRGANLFCIVPTKKGSRICKENLHQLWDRGFGVFDKAYYRTAELPSEYLDFSPKRWAEESSQYSDVVYSTPENAFPNNDYEQKAKHVVEQRVNLLVPRLKNYLVSHYARQVSAHE